MSVYRVFFFNQNTAYEMRISDWSSDVCSSDLRAKGVELGMMLKPVEALNLSANYTWMDAESRETVLDLARRPKHSINASAAYRWPFGLETGATTVHVGSSFEIGRAHV